MDTLVELLANNRRYEREFDAADLPTAPRRQLAVVACMDSRIDLFAVLGLKNGDAHIIRNAGGIVTEDVVRSLTVSRWLLDTRHILVMQHTRCGLHRLNEDEVKARIEASGLTLPFALGRFDDVVNSVRDSVLRLRANPLLAEGTIRGAVYDVDTGRLDDITPSLGHQTG
jgi:carbonic anhydrase